MEALNRYLSGDAAAEAAAVRILRHLGERAAAHAGFSAVDAEEVGVDFAAYMLTAHAPALRERSADTEPYLHRAARWYAAKQARSRRYQTRGCMETPVEDQVLAAPGVSPLSRLIQQETLSRVAAVVDGLKGPDQAVFELCLLRGVEGAEAGRRLGMKPEAIRKRLERLRARLRRSVEAWYEESA